MLNQFSNKINIVKPVEELLFKGFDDEIITMGKLSGMDDEAPPFDKFGWFYEVRAETYIFILLSINTRIKYQELLRT